MPIKSCLILLFLLLSGLALAQPAVEVRYKSTMYGPMSAAGLRL